jgi:predicted double-glycine peptidase
VYWAAITLALLLILLIAAGSRGVNFAAISGLSWILAGSHKLIAFALAAPVLQVALLAKLKKRRERLLVGIFLGIFILRVSLAPPLMAALAVPELSRIKTDIDTHGICMQRTGYTCVPASAVTLLRRLGIPAQEGELAILAGSNIMSGTDAQTMAQVINDRYGSQGIVAQYRVFASLDELRAAGPTLVIITWSTWLDHCVAVLDVNDRQVITADPVMGEHPYWKNDFLKIWLHNGVVIHRQSGGKR